MNENERPKRSKARKNYKEEQSDDDHEAPVDNYEPEPTSEIEKDTFKLVRPSKRKKNASPSKKEGPTKVRRRKAGSLERMLTLPPEMQDEILGHVAPETLVMCLQVRPFRQRLRMTSAESIWKRSRINAGMPALRATDMTERRYLTLLFDKHCHDCGDPKVNHNELDLLACVRLCTECRNNWKTYDNRKRLRMIKKLHVNAEECAKDFQSGGAPMPRGIDKISKYLNHLSRLQPEQIAPYVAKRKALKDQIEEDAATIQKWNRQVSEERFTNYGEILEARKAQIYQKLLEEGWTETTIPNGWEREAQVTYATKLTKAGWTKIKGPLQTALRWKIEWHRESERSARVRQAYQLILQDKPLFPSWTTFSRFPTIKALLDIPKADRPEHESFVAFDQAKWNAALPDTEPRVAAYEDRMRELAVQRLGEAYNAQGLPIPEDIISAPQSYFEYFQGEPPGDWNPISTQVDKFPKIHAIMRDRQPVGFHSVAPGEFETAKPPSYPGTREEWLKGN